MKHFLFFFASSITSFACVGGEITYRSDPELLWDARVQSVRAGNGVYLSRSEEILVASSNLGYISAFGARDGAEVFRYNYIPNTTDIEFISSSSGITFAEDYMVFSILVNKDTGNPLT